MSIITTEEDKNTLISKIKTRQAKIGIIGIGYITLNLAGWIAKNEYNVHILDSSGEYNSQSPNFENCLSNINIDYIKDLIENNKLVSSKDFSIISDLDIIIICVSNSINEDKSPDMSNIIETTKKIAEYLKKPQLITVESFVYPGVTQEVILPILESSNLKVGQDFFLAYTPDRIGLSGNKFEIKNVPKILSGMTSNCLEVVSALYKELVSEIVVVGSTTIAETVGLFENTFKVVNIALANELALVCDRMDINTFDVIDACATNPFGMMSFYPCSNAAVGAMSVIPYYLSWKSKKLGYSMKLPSQSAEINSLMPYYIKEKITDALLKSNKDLSDAIILILGLTCKGSLGIVQELPAQKLIEILINEKATVVYNDPIIKKYGLPDGSTLKSVELTDDILHKADCTLILNNHSVYDYEKIIIQSKVIVDIHNVTKTVNTDKNKIILI